MLCDVIFLVRQQGKFEIIDQVLGVKEIFNRNPYQGQQCFSVCLLLFSSGCVIHKIDSQKKYSH